MARRLRDLGALKKRRIFLIAGVLITAELIGVMVGGVAWFVWANPELRTLHQTFASRDRALEFHGVVRDEMDQGVAGATIELKVNWANWMLILGSREIHRSSTVTLTTDSEGKFVARELWGQSITIERVKKYDYWWVTTLNQEYDNRHYDLFPNVFLPDATNPALYALHSGRDAKVAKVCRGGGFLLYQGQRSLNPVKEMPIPTKPY